MSKVRKPKYSAEIPHVPMNFADRDSIVGRIMEILEAAMPEGRQLEATKSLVKKAVSEHFNGQFNFAYQVLIGNTSTPTGLNGLGWEDYVQAIWEVHDIDSRSVKATP